MVVHRVEGRKWGVGSGTWNPNINVGFQYIALASSRIVHLWIIHIVVQELCALMCSVAEKLVALPRASSTEEPGRNHWQAEPDGYKPNQFLGIAFPTHASPSTQ